MKLAPGIRTNLSGKFELSAIYMHGHEAVLLEIEAPDFYLVSFSRIFSRHQKGPLADPHGRRTARRSGVNERRLGAALSSLGDCTKWTFKAKNGKRYIENGRDGIDNNVQENAITAAGLPAYARFFKTYPG